MNTLDALLAGGQALTVNHGAVDYLINAGFLYGPGVILTAATVITLRTGRWVLNRIHCRIEDRASRRYCTAIATRLHQVADNADRIIAQAGDQLANQLLHQVYANDTHEGEK
jgi:hypothetical protein